MPPVNTHVYVRISRLHHLLTDIRLFSSGVVTTPKVFWGLLLLALDLASVFQKSHLRTLLLDHTRTDLSSGDKN